MVLLLNDTGWNCTGYVKNVRSKKLIYSGISAFLSISFEACSFKAKVLGDVLINNLPVDRKDNMHLISIGYAACHAWEGGYPGIKITLY